LCVELRLAQVKTLLVQGYPVEALGIEKIAGLKVPDFTSTEIELLGLNALARHFQVFPPVVRPETANQIVLMQALVDDDHCALGGIVEARHERAFNPFVDVVPDSFGFGLDRLHRIVDDDDMRPLAGDRPLDGRCQTIALGGGAQFDQRRSARARSPERPRYGSARARGRAYAWKNPVLWRKRHGIVDLTGNYQAPTI
jgi:hypothetical protein